MRVDDRGRIAGQRTVTVFQSSKDVEADYDELLGRRRSQRRNHAAALAAFVVVAVLAFVSVEANLASDSQPQPMQPAPGLDIGDVPVWYDDAGLHRGDVVDQTAVAMRSSSDQGAHLTLVRTGALYFDSERQEVWFHPWGGEARVIGRGAEYGAVGDPEGDNAAWWEGGELVVYDTVEAREITRVFASPASSYLEVGYLRDSSGIMQVSSDAVVWKRSQAGTALSLDLQTNEVVTVNRWRGSPQNADPRVQDVRAEIGLAVLGFADELDRGLKVEQLGKEDLLLPTFNALAGRLSADGRYLLAVTRKPLGTAFVDLDQGEFFILPDYGDRFYTGDETYPVIGWSYGHTALIVVVRDGKDDLLLACDASNRRCQQIPTNGRVILPWF